MDNTDLKARILKELKEKSSTKQAVWSTAQDVFRYLKECVQELANELDKESSASDDRVRVKYEEKGDFECRLQFSGDVLIFLLHTNAYALPHEHEQRKSSYLKSNPLNGYFGVIHIYNFLNDSIRYGRFNDHGQLIGRIYVNQEKHFFVEGQRQLGFLYRDLLHKVIDKEQLEHIVKTSMLYALDFDLTAPPIRNALDITVLQLENLSQEIRVVKTGNLGFRTKAMKKTKLL